MADASKVSIASVSPKTAPVGSSITINGSIPTPDGEYRICWNSPDAKPLSAGRAQGESVSETITVPNVDAGEHQIFLLDFKTKESGGAKFTVMPSITLDPTEGVVGTTVKVRGNNFAPGQVTVRYDGREAAKATVTKKTLSTSFEAPPGRAGKHIVTTMPHSSSEVFLLEPSITLEPSWTRAGTETRIAGNGFPAGEVIIELDGKEITRARSSGKGDFTASIAVPESTVKEHTITTVPESSKAELRLLSSAIKVSPGSGPAGCEISVDGEDFEQKEEIAVLFDGTEVIRCKANQSGTFQAVFAAPSVGGGKHAITTSPPSTSASFELVPEMEITPDKGHVGTPVELVGSGFAPQKKIALLFDGEECGAVEADKGGCFAATMAVRSAPSGKHIISTNPASREREFSVVPKLSIDPSRGAPNTVIKVEGTGFPSGRTVCIKYSDQDLARVLAGEDGSFLAKVTAPADGSGTHIITTEPPSTEEHFATPRLEAEPLIGTVGVQVKVTGSGFGPGESITLKFDGRATAKSVTDATGKMEAEFHVMPASAGEHQITTEPLTTTLPFTVIPNIALKPMSGQVGTPVTVIGRGFEALATISVSYDGYEICPAVTDRQGNFECTFDVPAGRGEHTVSAGIPPAVQRFTVVPGLKTEPAGGTVGSEVWVLGAGFPSGETVTILLDGMEMATATPDMMGAFRRLVHIPPTRNGDHPVETRPLSIPATFKLLPSLQVEPTAGPVGTTLNVGLTGYGREAEVPLLYDGLRIAAVQTDAQGSGKCTLRIPPSSAGKHKLATQEPAAVQEIQVMPTMSAEPLSGPVGTRVRVKATGFEAGRRSSAILENAEVATAIADHTGSFSVEFSIPPRPGGRHKLHTEPRSTEAEFEVTPKFSLKPAYGRVLTQVQIAGTGFVPGRETHLTFDDKPVLAVAPDENGNIGGIFTVPESAAGFHDILSDDPAIKAAFEVNPSFILAPAGGAVGTELHVSGNGFPAGRRISIRFDDKEIVSCQADGVGSFSLAVQVPESPAGVHRVATEPAAGESSFETVPQLAAEPLRATVGETLTITGKGLPAESRISVRLDDREIKALTADSKGSFHCQTAVPACKGGKHVLSTEPASGSITLEVLPHFTMNLDSGNVGAQVEVSGTGFDPGKRVSIKYDGGEVSAVNVDHDGNLRGSFAIPSSAAGPHRITTEPVSNDLTFTVLPCISTQPTAGKVGAEIVLTASGFPAGERTVIKFDGKEVKTVTANNLGGFNASFPAPPNISGPHVIQTDPPANKESFAIEPLLTAEPLAGPVGMEVRVAGSGFDPSQRISVEYDRAEITFATTDGKGGFRTAFRLPESPMGEHRIATLPLSDRVNITVQPSMETGSNWGRVGDVVQVKATGLPPLRRVSIRFDDREACAAFTNAAGSLQTAVSIPPSAEGRHILHTEPASNEHVYRVVPDIKVEPDQGMVGDQISLWGEGFRPGAAIKVLFDGAQIGEVTAESEGGFRTRLVVPPSSAGAHKITTDMPANEMDFRVQPSMTIEADEGPVGTRMQLAGRGFPATQRAFIRFDDQETAVATVDDSGSFDLMFEVPLSTSGPKMIVTEPASQSKPFLVRPNFSLNPASGHVGTEVEISGTGFVPGTLQIRYDDILIGVANVDPSGSFKTIVPVPPGIAGGHPISIQNAPGTRMFVVKPQLRLDRFSGTAGTDVVVSGTGFPPEPVSVRYDHKEIAVAKVDVRGEFSITFTIPSGIAGDYRFTTMPASTTESFTLIPRIMLAGPQTGSVSTPLSIIGEDFVPGNKVSIKYDGLEVASATPDGLGRFQLLLIVPPSTAGEHKIVTEPSSTTGVFHVTSRLVCEPAGGTVGTDVTATGTGFAPGVISIRYDGEHVATILTDSKGSFKTTFRIPPSSSGEHRITTLQVRG